MAENGEAAASMDAESGRGPAAGVDPRSKRWLTLALLCSTFAVGLDTSTISTAMPTVIGELGGIGIYSWVFSAFLLTATVSTPIYGKLADLFGRKPMYLVSASIFVLGGALGGQARSMEQLILFRFIQGVGAGGVIPITQTIAGDIFPLKERARIIGVFASTWAVAALVGPAVGGLLTEHVSWRWAFYASLPLSLVAITSIVLLFKERIQSRERRVQIDYLGALLMTGFVTALLFALRAPSTDDGGLPVSGPILLPVAAALLLLFLLWERGAPEPMVPLGLFRQRSIGVAFVVSSLVGVLLFAQSSFVPPFIQGVMGASPTTAGFVLAGTTVGWPLGSTLGGRVVMRWGYRTTALLGAAALVVGFNLLRLVRPDESLVAMTGVMALIGLGYGFSVMVSMLAMQTAVSWQQRGVMTSAGLFGRNIGGTIGVGIAGALLSLGMAGALPLSLGGIDPNLVLSAQGRATLPPEQVALLQAALSTALHTVYTALALLSVAVAAAIALLPGGNPERLAWRPPTVGANDGTAAAT